MMHRKGDFVLDGDVLLRRDEGVHGRKDRPLDGVLRRKNSKGGRPLLHTPEDLGKGRAGEKLHGTSEGRQHPLMGEGPLGPEKGHPGGKLHAPAQGDQLPKNPLHSLPLLTGAAGPGIGENGVLPGGVIDRRTPLRPADLPGRLHPLGDKTGYLSVNAIDSLSVLPELFSVHPNSLPLSCS